jgi:hypothetical protein
VILPYAGDRGRRAPTLEEIQRLVGERAPGPVLVSDPAWLATFRCQRRSTHAYRRGRVMLAGDAVHIHSPAGGQGMNTGIMDAHNLAWKLALVASRHSPDSLLDTYGQERGPVAADVLALTHTLVKLGTMTHPVQRALRNTIVPIAGSLAPIQRRAVRRMSHIHVAYPSSPLTHPDRSRAGIQPGQRAPDLEVTCSGRKTRLYAVLRKGRHVLLITGPGPAGALQARMRIWQDQIEVVTAADSPTDQPDLGPAQSVHLIRPDGYVAARGSVSSPGNLLDYLHRRSGTTGSHQVTKIWSAGQAPVWPGR